MKKFPDKLFAVKSINKKKLSKASWEHIKNEIHVLKETDCLRVVQFFETYEDKNFIHIVTELCEGGDLVSYVEFHKGVGEELAKRFFWQACTAVNYLHFFVIVHRDIKLDNFLLTKKTGEADLKLIDFGFATPYRNKTLHSVIGTPYYVAPEVLEQNYSFECDIWSLGVLLYMMVFAEPPFKGRNSQEIFKSIKSDEVDFTNKEQSVNMTALIPLIRGMLNKDPKKRFTMSQIFQSSWFNTSVLTYNVKYKHCITKQFLESLKSLPRPSKFMAEIVKTIVNLFSFLQPC